MYEKQLKDELFKNLNKLNAVHEELYGERDLDEDESEGLLVQEMDLSEEIERLLLQTRFFPLVAPASAEIKLLKMFKKVSRYPDDIEIERFLDQMMAEQREEIKKRVKKLQDKHIPAQVSPRIYHLYRQVINCYVNGNYDASCVLARAIAESIASAYVKRKGFGDLLHGKEKKSKSSSMQQVLREKCLMPTRILAVYSKITSKADNILHRPDIQADEKDAINTVRLLRQMIKEFPKIV